VIWLKRAAITVSVALLALFLLDRIFPPPIERGEAVSIMVSDRDGRPLRAIPLSNGTWRFGADLDGIDPIFVEALLLVTWRGRLGWHGAGRLELCEGRADCVWRIDNYDADRAAFRAAATYHSV
jgi:penicillin-binding protein 1C